MTQVPYDDIRRVLAATKRIYLSIPGDPSWPAENEEKIRAADGLSDLLTTHAEALLADAERWRRIEEGGGVLREAVALFRAYANGVASRHNRTQAQVDYDVRTFEDNLKVTLLALRNLTPEPTGETR